VASHGGSSVPPGPAPPRWEGRDSSAPTSREAPRGVACSSFRGDRHDRQVTARDSLREEVREGTQGQAQRTPGEGASCGADAAADAPEEAGRLTAPSRPTESCPTTQQALLAARPGIGGSVPRATAELRRTVIL